MYTGYKVIVCNIVLHKFKLMKYNINRGVVMIIFNVKNLMEKQNITRYRLQKLTNWNYKRINAYYFNKVISINVNELETLCDIFDCELPDLIELKKD